MGKKGRVACAVAAALVAVGLGSFAINHLHPETGAYDRMEGADKQAVRELAALAEGETNAALWKGFSVTAHPVLALKGVLGGGFLANPSSDPSGLFAREVAMPEGSGLSVYSVAGLAPDMLQFVVPAKFNSIGQTVGVLGSDVYFLRYGDDAFSKACDSGHFATMLAHEAFHYYAQNDWSGPSRFDTDRLGSADLDLLEEQYGILDEMIDELAKEAPSAEAMGDLADRYLDVAERRVAANPEYMRDEQAAETIEGTATYVGVKASEMVGYEFKVMRVAQDGEPVDLSFAALVPLMRDGTLDVSSVATDWTYQSGALLCQVLDCLGAEGWQAKLNAQTVDAPVTLYDLLAECRGRR